MSLAAPRFLSNSVGPPLLTFNTGKLDPSKTILGLAVTESGGDVGIMMGIKGGGAFATSDLAGTWYFIETADNPDSDDNGPFWSAATVTVDPTGAITGGSFTNSQGHSGALTGGSLSIDANGLVTGTGTSADGSLTFNTGKLDPSKTILEIGRAA